MDGGQIKGAGCVRPCLVAKNFQDFSSHQMFGHIYVALNLDEKKLITQFGRKLRDESFELN
jgi:transcriptional regulator of NAD metabolism